MGVGDILYSEKNLEEILAGFFGILSLVAFSAVLLIMWDRGFGEKSD